MTGRRFSIMALAALLLATSTAGAELYKWSDDQGRVHYSDSIPPEEMGERREREIKSGSGLTVERIEPPPTREELRARAEAQARAQARAREAAARRERDRILTETFESVAAMKQARDERLTAIQGRIDLARSRQEDLEARHEVLQQRAAAVERGGSGDLERLYGKITAVEERVRSQRHFIERQRREQAAIRARFKLDIQRFRELSRDRDASAG